MVTTTTYFSTNNMCCYTYKSKKQSMQLSLIGVGGTSLSTLSIIKFYSIPVVLKCVCPTFQLKYTNYHQHPQSDIFRQDFSQKLERICKEGKQSIWSYICLALLYRINIFQYSLFAARARPDICNAKYGQLCYQFLF